MALFDKEMTAMSNEILALKKEKEKSAVSLETVTTRVSLTFDLELYSNWGLMGVRSDKMAKVTISTGDNNPLIGVEYEISGLDSRMIRDVATFDANSGEIGRLVYLYSFNNSDLTTLNGGGSVELTYNMIITSTANVTVAVEYEDLWVN